MHAGPGIDVRLINLIDKYGGDEKLMAAPTLLLRRHLMASFLNQPAWIYHRGATNLPTVRRERGLCFYLDEWLTQLV